MGRMPQKWSNEDLIGAFSQFLALAKRRKDVKSTSMKTLPKIEISDDLDAQIKEAMNTSDLCKADVIRQALPIGLPQLAARFQLPPLWLEERIREALAKPAEPISVGQFEKTIAAIAEGG